MGFCRPASGFPALSVDHPSASVGLQHFHDWLDACTMQSCLYSQRNGPDEDGRTRCSGLGVTRSTAGIVLQILRRQRYIGYHETLEPAQRRVTRAAAHPQTTDFLGAPCVRCADRTVE